MIFNNKFKIVGLSVLFLLGLSSIKAQTFDEALAQYDNRYFIENVEFPLELEEQTEIKDYFPEEAKELFIKMNEESVEDYNFRLEVFGGGFLVSFDENDTIIKALAVKEPAKVKELYSYVYDQQKGTAVLGLLYYLFEQEPVNHYFNSMKQHYTIYSETDSADLKVRFYFKYVVDNPTYDADYKYKRPLIAEMEKYLKLEGYLD